MASNFVNPLASVASFKNQQLAPLNNKQGTTVGTNLTAGRTAQEAMDAGKPDLSALDNIRGRASRQHNLYLQAIKAQQQRQQPRVKNMNGGGNYSYNGGGGGGGAMGGRYNLIPGADKALSAMNAAFRKRFGYDLQVNSGGRTRAEQQHAYDLYLSGRGNLAAKPGTSVHESGRAVDFGGGIQNASSREHQWLQQNAGVWGFKWTGKNFSQFEPWHWEWWG